MRIARPASTFAVLAIAGVTVLAACGKSTTSGGSGSSANGTIHGAFGSVPAATGTPKAGRTITVAEPPSATPTYIMPITPAANGSVYTAFSFQYQMWRPLYWTTDGTQPKLDPVESMANLPQWSNGGKTVTFTMKTDYKWSNGSTVGSKDVLFWFDILKAALKEDPSNFGNYAPGVGVPDQVTSITAPNASTIVMNLDKVVNPTWFLDDELGLISPLPAYAWSKASDSGPMLDFTKPANAKKIYDYLNKASKSVTTYASNPLWQAVDGPYKLTSFNNTSGAFTMAGNKNYGGPHAKVISNLQAVPFTSDDAEFNAVKAGSIDLGYMPQNDVPQTSAIKSDYNVFGYPGFGWSYLTYNFLDKTNSFNKIIGQLYFRQAFAHLQNEKAIIKAFFHGAGGEAYGSIPSLPVSPYAPANALHNPYPYSVDTAVKILKAHGWTVNPGGTDVCANPGTGANQCGEGIAKGTKLAFNIIYSTSPAIIGQQVTELTSQAKKAGINISLSTSNFNFMISNYDDAVPAGKKNVDKWAMMDFGGFSENIYPTTSEVFNTGGSFNIGGYSDPKADALIKASTAGTNGDAVTKEVAYLTAQQPSLFQALPDYISVWKKTLSGDPKAFEATSQSQLPAEFMYFNK